MRQGTLSVWIILFISTYRRVQVFGLVFPGGPRNTKGGYLSFLAVRMLEAGDRFTGMIYAAENPLRDAARVAMFAKTKRIDVRKLRAQKSERWIRTPNTSPGNREKGNFAIRDLIRRKNVKSGEKRAKEGKKNVVRWR